MLRWGVEENVQNCSHEVTSHLQRVARRSRDDHDGSYASTVQVSHAFCSTIQIARQESFRDSYHGLFVGWVTRLRTCHARLAAEFTVCDPKPVDLQVYSQQCSLGTSDFRALLTDNQILCATTHLTKRGASSIRYGQSRTVRGGHGNVLSCNTSTRFSADLCRTHPGPPSAETRSTSPPQATPTRGG